MIVLKQLFAQLQLLIKN